MTQYQSEERNSHLYCNRIGRKSLPKSRLLRKSIPWDEGSAQQNQTMQNGRRFGRIQVPYHSLYNFTDSNLIFAINLKVFIDSIKTDGD